MSNKLLNAMLALVENRPEAARAILRSPDMKNTSISEVQIRLYALIDKIKADAAKSALRDIMQRSLRITIDSENEADAELIMTGVVTVETLLEEAIAKLES